MIAAKSNIKRINEVIGTMAEPNRACLELLVWHWRGVVEHSGVNKMNAMNLAKVLFLLCVFWGTGLCGRVALPHMDRLCACLD